MESSEDDAGTATNASRPETARESNIGELENVSDTRTQQENTTQERSISDTHTMSENYFDGESVSSSPEQIANSSTEAVLDMIDEFVDGPGATKRIPLSVYTDSTAKSPSLDTLDVDCSSQSMSSERVYVDTSKHDSSPTNSECSKEPECQVECKESTKSESVAVPCVSNELVEEHAIPCTSNSNNGAQNNDQVQLSQLKEEILNKYEDTLAEVLHPVFQSSENDTVPSSDQVTNSPKNSENESEPQVSEVERALSEHVVKCVTSSDSKEVVVESAESTSSDNHFVSEVRLPVETPTQTPLLNHLEHLEYRPRPDSTVSSTVDSMLSSAPELSSECATKDVSSSSDAVSTVNDSVKLEEVRSMSEISICKAETTHTPKKIKLIRHRPTPVVNHTETVDKPPLLSINEQCQSTSSDIPHINKSINEVIPPETCSYIASKITQGVRSLLQRVENECSTSEQLKKDSNSCEEKKVEVECQDSENITLLSYLPIFNSVDSSLNSTVHNSPSNSCDIIKESNICESNNSNTVNESTMIGSSDSNNVLAEVIVFPTISKSVLDESSVKSCSNLAEPIDSFGGNLHDSTSTSDVSCSSVVRPSPSSSTSLSKEIFKEPTASILTHSNDTETEPVVSSPNKCSETGNKEHLQDKTESSTKELQKTVPKLTIKVGNKQNEESKCSIPKVTIKPLKPPHTDEVKTIPKNDNDTIQSATKISCKSLQKPAEKIHILHRKSSSSEVSESEYSENDESTSDQKSMSDEGPQDSVPKVTIKLGKPGTNTEGKFYTESNIPKLTIKGIQNSTEEGRESPSQLKVVICQSEETQIEKVPKLTIKTYTITDSQPQSPKLTIKPLKPPDPGDCEPIPENVDSIQKLKIQTESSSVEQQDVTSHVPKITIKIAKPDCEISHKSPKKSSYSDNSENIPFVTKINIKPIIEPVDNLEVTHKGDEKIPVVPKVTIKPVVKPNEPECNKEDAHNIQKINPKFIRSPESDSSDEKDSDDSKINSIKPSDDEETSKESENHSSETGNSSDENNYSLPVVTKMNTKEENIPYIKKLNIKPLVKPDSSAPLSPKKDRTSSPDTKSQHNIPFVTRLNIKPIVNPEDEEVESEDLKDLSVKHPPLLMKINRKTVSDSGFDSQYSIHNSDNEPCNSISENLPTKEMIPSSTLTIDTPCTKISDSKKNCIDYEKNLIESNSHEESQTHSPVSKEVNSNNSLNTDNKPSSEKYSNNSLSSNLSTVPIPKVDCKPEENCIDKSDKQKKYSSSETVSVNKDQSTKSHIEIIKQSPKEISKHLPNSNSTLLKQLLENRDECSEKIDDKIILTNCIESNVKNLTDDNVQNFSKKLQEENINIQDTTQNTANSSSPGILNIHNTQHLYEKVNDNITKPLEINISDKINQSCDQDSPRIIIKINKTDHGASAKIITEDSPKPENKTLSPVESRRKQIFNSKKKSSASSPEIVVGKRLRSSRIVQSPEKRNMGRSPSPDGSHSHLPKNECENEFSMQHVKRLKLGQLLSQKSLTIHPVVKSSTQNSPPNSMENKQNAKIINHPLLNNENCSKNGSSKLHNILSNLQSTQLKVVALNDLHQSDKKMRLGPEIKTDVSLDEATVEISSLDHSSSNISDTVFQENIESQDFNLSADPTAQDPLEVDFKTVVSEKVVSESEKVSTLIPMTPQPKKRGRPRKLPVSEGSKPPIVLPTPALEERPQRSLRLSRERPIILAKPRGRGRGRGRRIDSETKPHKEPEPVVETAHKFFISDQNSADIDPTSSRIKLPRLTEALDKMPSACLTPLTSRRRMSSTSEVNYYESDPSELKAVMETGLPRMENPFAKSTEVLSEIRGRGRGGRGFRGRGRASPRTPRGRGRGRGGGRGAMYMKETMGIYGRVCGPATTTVELFEEETCMMDDNATPSKPSHLLDEDSQSSVKSSTNESSKMKKSKFEDLFDSKVWTASDVKEYTWPPFDRLNTDYQVMMIQEQVAMFLGVKGFKRRYPELKRRAIIGEEKAFLLSKGIVTEALCDLGITAVDASEVLDIMLSDYPHKYEEYRTYQRERQLTEPVPEPEEIKQEKIDRIEIKSDSRQGDSKPDLPKVDPEKLRQEMAAAAIASASEWNARLNAARGPACVDLQSMTIHRRRAPAPAPVVRVRPPHGLYPLALLPGQYQHTYRVYSPEELRYFPLNTALCAPPAPSLSASVPWPPPPDSDTECGSRASRASSDTDDTPRHRKRKKLTKVKRSSGCEGASGGALGVGAEEEEKVDTCRVCKLRLEANRKVTHERFLVCCNCNAKLHPSCVDLSPDTIRKCREYAWQCADCKTCGVCSRPADDDKMLFCDLCDRGFHIYCVGLNAVPEGRWHCVECAVCKSCGARSASGPEGAPRGPGAPLGSVTTPGSGAQWHHHTRRGPSGHKVYSHSLCTPCARAYRIGRYCPLCDRSFIGPKGTMQLVICKLCDRQLHQECVRRTGARVHVLDYTCSECRRGGITSRAAAVRLAPRTIATLFMAKRRFNKYAHRQYMQKCLQARDAPDVSDASDGDDTIL
ncbi:uncharacterized protein LOC126967917 isoform X2 [Leptidea sinapis]|uniref:uncharacterized protein LOC126967917 isoform X2 n=1 Tax=Leptidea sinapis TaxID=189913 RepID=UPI0021C48BAC|nr:uncharacterized protein LOC126967917 isoform X2 [Leptidea sinapis]